jgi:hypothetical protein
MRNLFLKCSSEPLCLRFIVLLILALAAGNLLAQKTMETRETGDLESELVIVGAGGAGLAAAVAAAEKCITQNI